MEEQYLDAGRAMSRQVLADLSTRWIEVFDAALAYQERNPDIGDQARRGPTDSPEAGQALVPHFATMHPQVLASCVAYCNAVVVELAAVTPPREHLFVTSEPEIGEGDPQPADSEARFLRLERWHADLEDEVVRLRRVIAGIADSAAQADRPTNAA